MFCFTAARWIHLFAPIIPTCASQRSALTLVLSATHYFALEQSGDNQSTRPSP